MVCVWPCATEGWVGGKEETGRGRGEQCSESCIKNICGRQWHVSCQQFDHRITPLGAKHLAPQLGQCIVKSIPGAKMKRELRVTRWKGLGVQNMFLGTSPSCPNLFAHDHVDAIIKHEFLYGKKKKKKIPIRVCGSSFYRWYTFKVHSDQINFEVSTLDTVMRVHWETWGT